MPEKAEPREAREEVGQKGQSEAKPKKQARAAAEALAAREAALDRAALQFKALGDPTRLRIVRLLAGDLFAGDAGARAPGISDEATTNADDAPARDGWTVGDLSARLFGKSKVSSTLSHHLKELRNAQLITMKRRGKNLICRIQEREIVGLRCYLAVSPDARAQTSPENQTLREGESRIDRIDNSGDRDDAPAV